MRLAAEEAETADEEEGGETMVSADTGWEPVRLEFFDSTEHFLLLLRLMSRSRSLALALNKTSLFLRCADECHEYRVTPCSVS
jgi:hypothetical protein